MKEITINRRYVGFFVPEIHEIATQACRPKVGPITPAHWYHLFLV